MLTSAEIINLRNRVTRRLVELGIKIETPIETHGYNAAGLVVMHLRPAAGAGQSTDAILAQGNNIAVAAGVVPRLYVDVKTSSVAAEFSLATPPTLYTSTLLKTVQSYSMTIGRDITGQPVRVDISDPSTPHVLVAGTTGAGKSALVQTMLATICAATPKLKVIAYDPIHVGMPAIADIIKPNVWEVLADPKPVVAWLKKLHESMKAGWVSKSRVLVVIDELADLIRIEPRITDTLIALAQRGRNSNIHLLLATQNPSAKVLSSDLVQCMPVRLVLSVVREVDSRQASGDQKIDAHKLPKPGHGVMCNGGQAVRFIAGIPDNYTTAQSRGFADARSDAPAQEPLPIVLRKPAPDRSQIQMQRDFALPAPVSPLGELVANALQTIEAEPVATLTRPADSYTLDERVALLLAWNPECSIAVLQKALKPGGHAGGFYAIQQIVDRLKIELKGDE